MTWSGATPTSGVPAVILQQVLAASLVPSTAAFKVAVFSSNTVTPSTTSTTITDHRYGGTGIWTSGNQTASGDYSAGGSTLPGNSGHLTATQGTTGSTNYVYYTNAGSPSWGGTTPVAFTVYGCAVYDNSSSDVLCYNYFGQSGGYTVTSGVFTINWTTNNGVSNCIASFAC